MADFPAPDDEEGLTEIFAQTRPTLLSIGYRLLGSRADAEDAAQDAFLRWRAADRAAIANPAAWLTTVYTRRCIDMRRDAHRARVDYVGEWLPEPIDAPLHEQEDAALASSLNMAFLLLLERLTPKERAAYLLREIFDADYTTIAATLGLAEPACRQLVARAKAHIGVPKRRAAPSLATQKQLLSAFRASIEKGEIGPLAGLLTDDIRITSDGGGKARALLRPLTGLSEAERFITQGLRRRWPQLSWRETMLNGALGVQLFADDGLIAAVTFAYAPDGRATDIFIMRNPDKLARLRAADQQAPPIK
ncbi:MAG: sigma-70 family RNA polymerase sigma factor [Neomegalonema sp.]|nr:sigma-70 family RNA polymerase sigma factor [Neomegalonema sp.]